MVRYKPSQFTKRELEIMVSAFALDKGLDFLTGGKLNKYSRKAAAKIVKTTLPIALRVGSSVGVSTARAALPLVTNPYLAGTALGLGALQTEPGQELLAAAEERGRMDRIRFEQALTDLEIGVGKVTSKTKSKFNTAVSKGMKAVKSSASYGKKGVINAPKNAFKAVVSTAAKLNKAKKSGLKLPKRPKTGIKKVIYNSMIGLFK
jgi:hypothetical protein